MEWFFLMMGLPFLFALIVPTLYKRFTPQIHIGWFVLAIPLSVFVYLLSYIPLILAGETLWGKLPWIPSYGIDLTMTIDGLSMVFGLIISGVGFLVVLYSIYYLSPKKEALHNFYIYLLMFMGAMLGLVFSDNIFGLYVFWEITSVSSFLLIAYWFQRENSRAGALKSLLITVFGGFCMLAGFILLYIITDTSSIREMMGQVAQIQSHGLFVPAMLLVLLGAFTKSAQFPFSIWLPDAMEAPTPVSAYLHSATMVKAGIYLVARLTAIFAGGALWFWLVSSIGLVTLFYGAINAVRQTDLKALLAYSTVSQLGLIMSLLGLGSAALWPEAGNLSGLFALAFFAAVFHLFNHATFKGCLFMVVGIIDLETGTRDIRKLGGLMYIMPVSFTLTMVGTLSMAGLPPFSGFLSKELFFTALLNASHMTFFNMESIGILIPIIAWIASIFTFIYCMIMLFKTFTGKPHYPKVGKNVHEAPVGMLIPPTILAGIVLVVFFFPNHLAQSILLPAWAAIVPGLAQKDILQVQISAWHGLSPEFFMTVGVVIIGAFLYKNLSKWQGIYHWYPKSLTLNNIYYGFLKGMESFSGAVTQRYMTGSVRDYLVYIFIFIVMIVGGALLLGQGFKFAPFQDAPVSIYEIALLLAMVVLAVTVLFARSRLTSILAVGALGYMVAFLFVLFRAPDLALTQLVVETVTTVLFLLCFYHLPKIKKDNSSWRVKATKGTIALGMGLVMTLVALSVNGSRFFPSISWFYENAYDLAGAQNIVNAILVDFRGVDTMLEILVLTMAGLGVYILVKLRKEGEERERT